jgi:hypothetical protein
MRKAMMGALTGFCLGAVVGYVAYMAYEVREGWTLWSQRSTWRSMVGEKEWISYYGLVGIVTGGGLAAIAGAVIGAAGAIVQAIRETRRFGPPPP